MRVNCQSVYYDGIVRDVIREGRLANHRIGAKRDGRRPRRVTAKEKGRQRHIHWSGRRVVIYVCVYVFV